MSIDLKHLPCPAGSSCSAFQCIFGHPGEESQKRSHSGDEADSGLEGPKKRLKQNELEKPQPDGAAAGNDDKHGTAKLPKTAPRPVSTPSLAKTRTPKASNPSPATSPESLVSSSSELPQSKKIKTESLNPRLLKRAPASHELRLKLLMLLHDEYSRLNQELTKDGNEQELKLVLSHQQLITKALDEEQKTALEKPTVYSNVMKNRIMFYRRMKVAQWKDERQLEIELTKRRESGDVASDMSKKIVTGLTPAQEVQFLKHIGTPIDGLGHGYVAAVPPEDSIETAREGLRVSRGWEKCDRCQQRFQVFPGRREEDGALTTGGPCKFHWGKTYVPERNPVDRLSRGPKRYRCCGAEVGETSGCTTHETHVFKVTDASRLASVLNFAETPENSVAPVDRAVCFDCEMGYTVHGMELVRLTATSWPSGDVLLDVLVQPLGEVLDLNTRYSGVQPDDLALAEPWDADGDAPSSKPGEDGKTAKKRLKKVSSPGMARDLLFSLISPTTPLIGHGLENDLNAVRIVHPTLVDTVLLYPHKSGLPCRNGLRKLMEFHLNRKIQQETGLGMIGHDSAEDARAAGDLVRLKVMDEWKHLQLKGWKLTSGGFVPEKGKDSEPPQRQSVTSRRGSGNRGAS